MKTSSTWKFRSIVGKMMMGLVLAAMIGSIQVAPALARDDDKGRGKHDNRDNRRYDDRRSWHDNRRDKHGHVYRQYYYRERYYAPPPVVYAPPPPPGISIFFPPIFIGP